MSTFPLATVAPAVTSTGITAPQFTDILKSYVASLQSIFGSDALLTPDTQEYQLLAVLALAQSDTNQAIIAAYNSYSPTFAQGVGLSSIVKINGIARQVASNSTATVTIVGVSGTVISNGVVQDANGNLWNLPVSVAIPGSGTVDVQATAQLLGAIAAGPNTVSKISTPTLGWQSVTNAAAAAAGAPVESDAALRRRQTVSTGLAAQTPLQAILAAVANIVGVAQAAIYENPTGVTDSNGVPRNSISVITLGGTPALIAHTIEQKKSPGTGTYGSTSVLVSDPAGVPVIINYYQLVQVNIYVSISLHPLTGYVNSTQTALVAAIVSFINGLSIGLKVYYNWILSIAAQLNNPALGETYIVTALTLGTAPAPVGTVDVAIAFNQGAICAVGNIVITVS